MTTFFIILGKIIVAIYDKIAAGLVYVGSALILFMMLSIAGSVLFRRTFFDFAWALEVSEYILIISTLLGSGWLLRTGSHVRVDILSIHLYGRTRDFYNALIYAFVALICLSFTIIGLRTTIEAYLSGTLEIKVYLQFQKWILLCLFPLAGFIMFIEACKQTARHLNQYLSLKHDRTKDK